MEAGEGVVSSSPFAITSDGPQQSFSVSLARQEHGLIMVAAQQDMAAPPAHVHQPSEAQTTQLAGLIPTSGVPTGVLKKKRGRPRKYGPDGSVLALSPMPISASISLVGDSSGAWRGRSIKKKQKTMSFDSPGEKISYLVGTNFTPHVLKINPGEDVTMKIMSFSQQASRAVCVLSANGAISNVTLRQPTSLGGTLTYEGRFEILSLSGSYTPVEAGGTASRSSGMSVSLAGPDGRVVGGGLTGLLVAAGLVQVVLGSFLPVHQLKQKPKKQKVDVPAPAGMPPVINNISSRDETLGLYNGDEPIV